MHSLQVEYVTDLSREGVNGVVFSVDERQVTFDLFVETTSHREEVRHGLRESPQVLAVQRRRQLQRCYHHVNTIRTTT